VLKCHNLKCDNETFPNSYLFLAKMKNGWIVNSYNKTNEMHKFLRFIFGIELYMFRTGFLSIIRSLVLYTQQYVYVIQVLLTAC